MKKIAVITSSRADYGLLYWTIKKIEEDSDLVLQLFVTGMHLNPKFGSTYKIIEDDGIYITDKIDLGEHGDDRKSILSQMSLALTGFSSAFEKYSPDLVLVLGDRYEIFSVAQASLVYGIPIAHIHGGELTEGAFDDAMRHSITKMSHLHLTSTEAYQNRVMQMGEEASFICCVGAPGLENFKKLKLLSKTDFENEINFKLKDKNLLITYHPVTIGESEVDEFIQAISRYKEYGQVITLPNSDPGHEIILEKLTLYASENDNIYLTSSLGQLKYLSAMKICDVVVGNSSSGIIESPFVGTPSVNIGERQGGRLADKSVVNCGNKASEIIEAIDRAIKMEKRPSLLYGDGMSSQKIIDFIKTTNIKKIKKFVDIGI